MIPIPVHIQRQLSQGIESVDFRRQKTVDRVTDPCLFGHDFSFEWLLGKIPAPLRRGRQGIVDDGLGFLQDAGQMIRPEETLRIDLVNIFGP